MKNKLVHIQKSGRRRFNGLVGLALLILTMTSCIQIDTPPELEVQVLDAYNNPVKNAVLGLFDSQEEWAMLTNPIQTWKTTNDEGKVRFVNLQEINYFIFAEKGSLNNLKSEIATSEKLLINEVRLITVHID